MTEPPTADDRLSPSEERLLALLTQLRADSPRASESLTATVLQTARWQSLVRRVLRSTGAFATSMVTGVDVLLGLRRGGDDRSTRR